MNHFLAPSLFNSFIFPCRKTRTNPELGFCYNTRIPNVLIMPGCLQHAAAAEGVVALKKSKQYACDYCISIALFKHFRGNDGHECLYLIREMGMLVKQFLVARFFYTPAST